MSISETKSAKGRPCPPPLQPFPLYASASNVRDWISNNSDLEFYRKFAAQDAKEWDALEDCVAQATGLTRSMRDIFHPLVDKAMDGTVPRKEVEPNILQQITKQACERVLQLGGCEERERQLKPWLLDACGHLARRHIYLFEKKRSFQGQTEVLNRSGPAPEFIQQTSSNPRKRPLTSSVAPRAQGLYGSPPKKARLCGDQASSKASWAYMLYNVIVYVILDPGVKGFRDGPACVPIAIPSILDDACREHDAVDIHVLHLSWERFLRILRNTWNNVDVDGLVLAPVDSFPGTSPEKNDIKDEKSFHNFLSFWLHDRKQEGSSVKEQLVLCLKRREEYLG